VTWLVELWARQPQGTKVVLVAGGILISAVLCWGGATALTGARTAKEPTTVLTRLSPSVQYSSPVSPSPTVDAVTEAAVPAATTVAPAVTTVAPRPAPPVPEPPRDVYYANCAAARAAGAAPLYRGDPGYRSGLDADSDGIACERR
jgi:hypothetical protein